MVTTSILPLTLGQAVLGRSVEPGGEAPKHLRVHGECWELVTDPLLDIALVTDAGNPDAQAAFAARLANILHLNVGNLVVTEGATVNALVAKSIAAATASVLELDADRITSGTIDTARLNAVAIAAAVATVIEIDADRITAGKIDTARLHAEEVAAAVASFLSLNAGQITAGTISTARLNTSQIASAVATIIELNADRITSGTLSSDRIAANSITAAKILVDGTLAAQVVQAMSVATKRLVVTEDAILNRATVINGLAADVVTAATIYASQLVVSALDKDGDLRPGTVDTVQIVDGAVRAAQIHAEEVAGAVARFLTIEVGQLVAGTAAIDSLVALKIAGATADFQEAFIQNLRTNGAVIDEAVIGDLAANIITSGLFRTAAAGQRLEIDSSGLVMYGLDPDGLEYEMVRLGPTEGENLLTIGDTVITPTSIDAPEASFETLTVGGDDLNTILATLPRGVIARGSNNVQNRSIGPGGVTELGELSFDVATGRAFQVTVEPLGVYASSGSYMHLNLHWTVGENGGDAPAPTMSDAVVRRITSRRQGSDDMQFLGGSFYIQTGATATSLRMLFTLTASGGNGTVFNSALGGTFRVIVQDMGPSMPDIMVDRTGATSTGSSTTPPPPPAKRTYTKAWDATGFRVYDNNGNQTSDPDVVQGLYAGGPSRLLRKGGWLHPSMTGTLAGATIERIRVKLYVNHTYYSAGSTVNVCTWGGVMRDNLTTQVTVNGWKRGTSKWVTLPASTHAGFQSGAIAGIGVKPTTTSAAQYARLATNAVIEITYTK